jgi:hypothetical protein
LSSSPSPVRPVKQYYNDNSEELHVLVPLNATLHPSPPNTPLLPSMIPCQHTLHRIPQDILLHIITFLNQSELALTCALVNKQWRAAILSPTLPHWQTLNLAEKWHKITDEQVFDIACKPRQFSRLQRLFLDDCVEVTVQTIHFIAEAHFAPYIKEISFCGCSSIKPDKHTTKIALVKLVSNCESLENSNCMEPDPKTLLELYKCRIRSGIF